MLKLAINLAEAPFFSDFKVSSSWVDEFGVYYLEAEATDSSPIVIVKPEHKQVAISYTKPKDVFKVFCPGELNSDFVHRFWYECEKLRLGSVRPLPQCQLDYRLFTNLFKECNLPLSTPDIFADGYLIKSHLDSYEVWVFAQLHCLAFQVFDPSGKLFDTYKQPVPGGVDYLSGREFLLNCLNGFTYLLHYELELSKKKQKLEELIR